MIRILEAARRFLAALPAFALGLALLRLAELLEGWPPGTSAGAGSLIVAGAFSQDLLALGRYLPALFLVSSPLLVLRTQRARFWGIASLWSFLILVQVGLVGYFLNTRVPLGADLFSYSWSEIGISAAGSRPDPVVVFTGLIAIAGLWLVLWRQSRRVDRAPSARATVLLFGLCCGLFVAAPRELLPPERSQTEYARSLRLTKLAAFVDSNVDAIVEHRLRAAPLQWTVRDAHAQEGTPAIRSWACAT
jgi:hypothetical protein